MKNIIADALCERRVDAIVIFDASSYMIIGIGVASLSKNNISSQSICHEETSYNNRAHRYDADFQSMRQEPGNG